MLQGDGLEAIKAMWALVALATVIVFLRLYTRILVVRSYAADDSVYNAAFVSYTSCLSVDQGYLTYMCAHPDVLTTLLIDTLNSSVWCFTPFSSRRRHI